MANGWHEDFGDEPSIEERIPEGWDFVDTSVEDDHELIDENGVSEDDADEFRDDEPDVDERQELEDFEQADEYFNHYDYADEYGGEG